MHFLVCFVDDGNIFLALNLFSFASDPCDRHLFFPLWDIMCVFMLLMKFIIFFMFKLFFIIVILLVIFLFYVLDYFEPLGCLFIFFVFCFLSSPSSPCSKLPLVCSSRWWSSWSSFYLLFFIIIILMVFFSSSINFDHCLHPHDCFIFLFWTFFPPSSSLWLWSCYGDHHFLFLEMSSFYFILFYFVQFSCCSS